MHSCSIRNGNQNGLPATGITDTRRSSIGTGNASTTRCVTKDSVGKSEREATARRNKSAHTHKNPLQPASQHCSTSRCALGQVRNGTVARTCRAIRVVDKPHTEISKRDSLDTTHWQSLPRTPQSCKEEHSQQAQRGEGSAGVRLMAQQ